MHSQTVLAENLTTPCWESYLDYYYFLQIQIFASQNIQGSCITEQFLLTPLPGSLLNLSEVIPKWWMTRSEALPAIPNFVESTGMIGWVFRKWLAVFQHFSLCQRIFQYFSHAGGSTPGHFHLSSPWLWRGLKEAEWTKVHPEKPRQEMKNWSEPFADVAWCDWFLF